jgi:hypothetical protein
LRGQRRIGVNLTDFPFNPQVVKPYGTLKQAAIIDTYEDKASYGYQLGREKNLGWVGCFSQPSFSKAV